MSRVMTPLLLIVLAALAAPADAGSLRYAEDSAPAIVNPLYSTTMAEARVNELLFGGLYADDRDLRATPLIAEGATLNAAADELRVTVRPGLTWHDGKPLTARDVAFTVETLQDPKTLSTEAGRVDWVQSVSVVNDRELVFKLKRPDPQAIEKLFFKILPAHAFASRPVTRADAFRTKPVGSGPYRLARFGDDNSITFAANPNYPKALGVSEIVMREVSDKSYQAKLLLYESLEALVRVLPRDLAVLQKSRKVELYPYQTNSWWYIGFNLNAAPFDDERVRQALACMTDVPSLLAPIGTGQTLSGPFVRSSPYYNHDVPPWPNDNARAAELMKGAGFTKVGEYWSRDGQALTVTVSAHKTLESAQEVVINLQSQWRAAGVKVDVEFLDEAAWKARIWKQHDYDVVLAQWSFDRNEDVREQLHSSGARNFGGYKNAEVDALLDSARASRDPAARKADLRKVHAIVHDDAPMIFLWSLDSYSAVSTKVRDVVVHPFAYFSFVSDWKML